MSQLLVKREEKYNSQSLINRRNKVINRRSQPQKKEPDKKQVSIVLFYFILCHLLNMILFYSKIWCMVMKVINILINVLSCSNTGCPNVERKSEGLSIGQYGFHWIVLVNLNNLMNFG